MRRVKKKNTRVAPPRQRQFAPVDLEEIEAAHENPDWLVGSN